MKRLFTLAFFSLILASANLAEAGWVSGFDGGHTDFVDAPGAGVTNIAGNADGTVSFAVWDNLGDSDWTDNWGSDIDTVIGTSAGIDTSARYIYFYQVVNTDIDTSNETTIENLYVNALPGQFTSGGDLGDPLGASSPKRYVFDEDPGAGTSPVGASPNNALGDDTLDSTGVLDGSITGTSASALSTTDPFVLDSGAKAGTGVNSPSGSPPGGLGGNAVQFTYETLSTGEYTTVLWLTSNHAPLFGRGVLEDGSSFSVDDLPTPVPAPAGLVLLLTGIPSIAGFGWYQRRRKSVATV